MSTPVGQSEAQPLQARQRSRASRTSGEASPRTRVPLTASWSTRLRPLVVSFSSLVASQDGHITPPAAVLSATHRPIPVQRCTALVRSPPSSV